MSTNNKVFYSQKRNKFAYSILLLLYFLTSKENIYYIAIILSIIII